MTGFVTKLDFSDNRQLIQRERTETILSGATVLGVPCITLRKNTERPVTVEQGTNLLVSTDANKVIEGALKVIDNKIKSNGKIPELWDGKAAERILDILIEIFLLLLLVLSQTRSQKNDRYWYLRFAINFDLSKNAE